MGADAGQRLLDGQGEIDDLKRRRYEKKWPAALRTHVAVCCCIMFAEGYFVLNCIPYLSFQTEVLRHSDEYLGTTTGIISSAQPFGMIVSAYAWAWAANHYGRRTCLLVGLSCNVVLCTCMTWCTDYWLTVLLRFLIGVLNNNLSIVRTSLREKFQLENEDDTAAFSTLSVAFGASCLIGPSVGGILYGVVPPGGWRAWSPWTTPMLVTTAVYAVTLLATSLVLQETAQLGPRHAVEPAGEGDIKDRRIQGGKLLHDGKFLLLLVIGAVHSYVYAGYETCYPLFARLGLNHGGEAWTTSQIGFTVFLGSGGLMLYSMTFYNQIARRLPRIWVYIVHWILPLIAMPFFPRTVLGLCAAGFPHHGLALQMLNYFMQMLMSVLLGSQFITVQLLLNEYVTDPDKLSIANGYMMSCQSFVRAIGPVTTGTLFTWGHYPRRILGLEVISLALPFDHLALLGWIFGVMCAVLYSRWRSQASV